MTGARWTIDLLAPRHQARTFRERSGHSLGPTRAYHQALDLVSRFTFERGDASPAHLRLACRLPTTGENGEVRIRLNGADIASVDAGRAWKTFAVDCETRAGANELTIEWPLREPLWNERIEADARRLERAVFPDALPAYGEIYELRLTGASPSSR
jgi:hypothetical protein